MTTSLKSSFVTLFQSFVSFSSEKEKQAKISNVSNSIFRSFKKQHPVIDSSHQAAYNACIHIAFHNQIMEEMKTMVQKTDLISAHEKESFLIEFIGDHYTSHSVLNSLLHNFWKEHCDYKNYSFRYLTELFFTHAHKYLVTN